MGFQSTSLPCLIWKMRARNSRQRPRGLERFGVRQGARSSTWRKEGTVNENKFLSKLWEEIGQIMVRVWTCSEGP